MIKADIVSALEEIAVLLELRGENPFKIRAYQTGARALETMEEDLDALLEANELGKVPGIGSALIEKVATLRADEALPFLDELRASIEPGLVEMLEIPGLGAKRVRKMHEALGVDSIESLQAACKSGAVAEMKGFGAKTAEKILHGIVQRAAYAKRHLWWQADLVARPILEGLRELPQVKRAEIAGSLRRLKETVGDLDFVVAASEVEPVMEWFVSQSSVESVTAQGTTKSSVRFEGGLQADLRVVPEEQFAFALHHFTGSKEHNVALRQRALARGFSLSEWGLTQKDGADGAEAGAMGHGIKSEAGLFQFLGLTEIPPELREGMGELEAAEAGTLPELLEPSRVRGVFHNHTDASDGRDSLEAMALAAKELGFEYLGLADHSKASFQANGLDDARVLKQLEKVRAYNASESEGAHLFAGIECDILKDGSLDLEDTTLSALDYVVVSVHSAFGMGAAEMTQRVIRAIEHPTTTMLGHPTGRLLLRREAYAIDLAKIIDAAIANQVIIEINANPQRLDLDWRLWRRAAERGLHCAINPDAHGVSGLDYFRAGVNIARKGWLPAEQVLNCRDQAGVERWFAKRQ
ncbi:MAG: DNA polymerase/3'-5' exonuclease PolX [Opitutia bacterium UBA7350]|nr:MAG: DNA polymerase/3'-5' exonuclease PolX [Opitutae bacterium UBA7350]